MTAPADPDSPSPGLLLFRRTTCDGRNLIYRLQILQQPDRARACGAGTKAHSDRRPIDPPPVVEFRIFQGHAADDPVNSPDAKDVTFRYPANFFLFATLENARPIAHGRIVNAASQAVPVLSGMPVAGLAYLDRPIEAGYFLFPDLSVRHEGLYRLAFNLYEQTKEDRDMDEPASSVPLQNPCLADVPMSGSSSEAAFDWRMEVKSRLFRVFSAKKFPGLCESTILSRTVAEQGCRVRIRRDVRMRRRHRKYNPDHALDGDDANGPQVDDGQEGLDASDCQDHSNFADSRNGNHQMDGRLVPEIQSRLHTPNFTRVRPSSTAPDRKAGMSRRLSNIRDFAIASAPYSPMSEPRTSHAEDLDVKDSRNSRCRQHYSRSTSLEPGLRSNTHQTLSVVAHSSAHETFFQPTSANDTDSPPACSSYPPYGNDRRRSSSLQSQTRAQSVAMSHPSQSALKPLLPPLSTITTLPYDSVPYEFGILPLDVLDAMEPQSPSAPLQHAGDKRVFDASFVDHSNMPLYDGHRPDSLAPLLTCRRSPSLLSHTPSGLHDSMISYNRNDSNVITRENSF